MNPIKYKFNMRARLFTAFAFVALLPMILLSILYGRSTRRVLIDNANQALLAVASETAASLDTFISTNLEAIKIEAQLPEWVEYLNLPAGQRQGSEEEDIVLALLQTLDGKDPDISSYALLDNQGINLVDTMAAEIGQDKSRREYFTYFQENGTDKVYVSPVQFSPATGAASLYFSSPVMNTSGELIGVLRVRYQAGVLQQILVEKNDIAGAGSFGVLFDEHHIHLAHGTAPEVNYIPIIRLPPSKIAELRAELRLPDLPDEEIFILQLDGLEEHLSNSATQQFFEAEDVATGEMINQVAITQMATQPWLVTFFQPQDIFLAPVEAQTRTAFILSGFIAVASVLAAFGMGHVLGVPILRLTHAVTKFTTGDLEARMNIVSSDEIGVLASSFNTMAKQVGNLVHGLEERTRELEKEIDIRERVEEALREREGQFRGLLESAPDAIVISDQDGRITLVNRQIERLFGYTREELVGEAVEVLMPGRYQKEHVKHRANYVAKPRTRSMGYDFNLFAMRKDGSEFPAEISLSPLKTKDGFLVTSIIRDITARKQTEEAIRISEARYRVTSELTSDYIYSLTVTADNTFVLDWATDAFSRLTGYTPQELAARGGWTAIIHPEDLKKYEEMRDRLLATGESDIVEYRIITINGEIKWLRDHRRPTWDEAVGRVTSILGASYDYTVRKESELELKKLAAIIENSDDAILSVTPEGIVLSWNPGAEKMFGYKAEEAIGELLPDLIAPSTVGEESPALLELLAHSGHVNRVETLRVTKSGKIIDASATLSVILDAEGNITAISAILRDITEQRKAERELKEAKEAAETANRAKSVFLANMSHELRTPLNAILGFTQLLTRDQSLARDQQENVEIISRSGEHLLALINDILEVSKIEAGRTTLKENSFDLHQLLDDMKSMFTLRAHARGLALIFERSQDVPRDIHADEGKLRQVLINLIGNAVKFTEQGRVSIRAGCHNKAGDHRLLIEVEDTGPGISPAELESLFEAFVQTKAGEASQEGTGLGLSISQQFVRMMGGEIKINSEIGKGSIFSFDIPIRLAVTNEVQYPKKQQKVIGIEPDQPTYRILIVEDRLENRKLLIRLLRPFGFEIREAVNGQEAIKTWSSWEPHLIWMDMRMPVMDGFEATRRIKATAKGRDTIIIAITASVFEEDREMVVSTGSDDFVRKPFKDTEIFEKMSEHLGIKFIYSQVEMPAGEPPDSQRLLSPENLAAIPSHLLLDLHQATIQADFDMIFALIESIRQYNEPIAGAFTRLANNFEYDKIISLLQEVPE